MTVRKSESFPNRTFPAGGLNQAIIAAVRTVGRDPHEFSVFHFYERDGIEQYRGVAPPDLWPLCFLEEQESLTAYPHRGLVPNFKLVGAGDWFEIHAEADEREDVAELIEAVREALGLQLEPPIEEVLGEGAEAVEAEPEGDWLTGTIYEPLVQLLLDEPRLLRQLAVTLLAIFFIGSCFGSVVSVLLSRDPPPAATSGAESAETAIGVDASDAAKTIDATSELSADGEWHPPLLFDFPDDGSEVEAETQSE